MKVLLIEDERLGADRISNLLKEYDQSIQIVDRIDSVKRAIEVLDAGTQFDLIFLDIELADGLCFEIFEKCNVTSPVIFTTAYKEYAIKAFKLNSIDYLLKPVGFKELKAALDKFKTLNSAPKLLNPVLLEDTQLLLNQQYKTRFLLKVGEHLITIPVDKINCFFSLEKATFIQTVTDKKYLVDYSLDQIEGLVDPKTFFRINRKYIISYNSIKDIIDYSNSRLRIVVKYQEDNEIIISREKANQFKEWLDS